jgi:hypothetical protein
LYRLYKPKLKGIRNKTDCLLDTDATGNENHVFDSLDVYSSGRPYKAATHADIDFFAEDFFLGFPEPRSWWVSRRVLDG